MSVEIIEPSNPDMGDTPESVISYIESLRDRIDELEGRTPTDEIVQKLCSALEDGSPPGDCWIRKSTAQALIRAALQKDKQG